MERVPDEKVEEQARDGRCHHNGTRFTGIGFLLHPTGELAAEDEYRDGLLWGLHRRYHPGGGLFEEGERVAGHMEGVWRRWHPNGRLACEEFCYFDFTLARMRWDADGGVVEDFVLAESAPQYRLLLRYREGFGRTGEPIPVPPKLPTPAGLARRALG